MAQIATLGEFCMILSTIVTTTITSEPMVFQHPDKEVWATGVGLNKIENAIKEEFSKLWPQEGLTLTSNRNYYFLFTVKYCYSSDCSHEVLHQSEIIMATQTVLKLAKEHNLIQVR